MQPQNAPRPPIADPTHSPERRGRGLVITGSVLVGIAIAGVAVTVMILGRSFDPNNLNRDVVLTGSVSSAVPGQVGFRVLEHLSSPDETMDVGVALEPNTAEVYNSTSCVFSTLEGTELDTRPGGNLESFLSSDIDSNATAFAVAEDLEPGDYSVSCATDGEPSTIDGAEFRVGRVVSPSEFFGLVGPVFWILGAVVIGGIVGFLGVVLLVIGLVQNNRARRPPDQYAPGPLSR